ncbi:hypothetical protein [Luteimonas fraxinea]|uniref:hypothetical protein n=1 Tax=Luteimonas fraxinea TaxID=2901869 RepID=UPI001E4CB4BB|nr:hypothetical protein [Luteimonas fraxinea]MCD9127677.1 hypothetical protein [Luteimonas fraxinea]
MTRVIQSDPQLKGMIEAYTGSLPTGKAKNRRFDALHKAFVKSVGELHGANAYPLGTADKGRRQLLRYLRRLRRKWLDAGAPVEDRPQANANSLRDFLELRPLERVEFDAHAVDVELRIEVEKPDGTTALLSIRRLTLLTIICTVTRYLLAHLLVLGEYNRLHVLRVFRKALLPWRPRELLVPGLSYPKGARLGLPVDSRGGIARPIIIAGDNAMSHHATIARQGLHRHHRGLLNFGRAKSPEARGLQEAFFYLIERGALRGLPGGFEPGSDGKRRPANALRAEDYPLQWQALQDTMEVVCAGYNVTPHNGLHQRMPLQAVDAHLATGWLREVSESERDARGLTTIRIHPTIRGGSGSGRYPYIEYQGAIYRSEKLRQARSRVGEKVNAEVDVDDLTSIVLLDDHGMPWSRLQALPPWHRTPHDLHLRQQINRMRNRALFSVVGADDAVAAYADCCRAAALNQHRTVDAYARVSQEVLPSTRAVITPESSPSEEQEVEVPRTGRTSFATRRE